MKLDTKMILKYKLMRSKYIITDIKQWVLNAYVIDTIHFNKRFFENVAELEKPSMIKFLELFMRAQILKCWSHS